MAKPDLGNKQKCQNCGTKFFDMNKDPITCPKCGTIVEAAGATVAAARAPAGNSDTDDEETETDTGAEVVSLEDADSNEDGKVAAADPDEEIEDDDSSDDDTFLEEEEEDDGDVSDLIDGDIEDDEER